MRFFVFKKSSKIYYTLKLIPASFSIIKKKKKTHRNLQQFSKKKIYVYIYAPHPAPFIFIIKRDKDSRRYIATFRVNGSKRYATSKIVGNDNEIAIGL